MLKRSSTLMTLGGILSGVGTGLVGIPITVTTYYAQIVKDGVPHWFSGLTLPMILLGFLLAMIGTVILGIAGKGQDDIPTAPQVEAATAKAVVEQKVLDANAVAQPAMPSKVIVETPKGD